MVNLARKSVGRKPFGHRVRIEERSIDLLGRGTQHAVKPDGVCRHYLLLMLGESSSSKRQSLRRGSPPPNGLRLSGGPTCSPAVTNRSTARPLRPLVRHSRPRRDVSDKEFPQQALPEGLWSERL